MSTELLEIRDHLRRFPPFDELPDTALQSIAGQLQVGYFKAGSPILELDAAIDELHYIRSGAVELQRRSGSLHNRLSEGDIFGQASLLRDQRVRLAARALEDCLIYFIPAALFEQLCEAHDSFADFVEAEGRSRLKSAVRGIQGPASDLHRLRLGPLLSRSPVCVDEALGIRQVARVMTGEGVSSVLVTRAGSVSGILTDRDLRTRVLAEGLPLETPVREVMTRGVISLQADDSLFDAMLGMLRHNIHHLPILDGQQPVGLLSLADIVRHESRSSLHLVGGLYKRSSSAELAQLLPEVQATFLRMVNDGASAQLIGCTLSSIGRAFCQRLLELAEQQLGPPPVPYCLMVAGSMARDEQLLGSDQDNALVLHDSYDPQRHGDYFAALAQQLCDGLAACGYSPCKGGIMASNPQWRQPLAVWRNHFSQWISRPDAQTLLNSSIFFDLEGIHGQIALVEQLKAQLASQACGNPAFLAALARNALNRTPPLGFFRTFVMETDGRQRQIINIKGRGTAPLTDLIRVHALACGSREQNSLQRLEAIAGTRLLPPEALAGLRDSFELLSSVRIRQQARQIEDGQPVNNYIEPEQFDASARRDLKEAFQVIAHAQKFLRFRYPRQAGRA